VSDQQNGQEQTFDEWAILELLGHRRVAGRVREVQLAGAGMLRVDVPATPGRAAQTSWYGPGAVYGVHPVTEEVARAVAERFRSDPVHRWELPAAPAIVAADSDEALDADDPDDGEGVWGG
jgi:hypothetical protein